ncbi:hypothetical protein TIFTF001_041887 [Ficus carica]|uniref:Uncharacterized protein n=1 Tax=Ficus carica TaxID=3494 RepID=A0AA87ZHK1_FICCA|nr:hypothetical protein TIFTF001_041887 [Ficus carica]
MWHRLLKIELLLESPFADLDRLRQYKGDEAREDEGEDVEESVALGNIGANGEGRQAEGRCDKGGLIGG